MNVCPHRGECLKMRATLQDTHIWPLPSVELYVCQGSFVFSFQTIYDYLCQSSLLIPQWNINQKKKKWKKERNISMNAELKALKRLRTAKKKKLWNWVWLRQGKDWENHKILARFCNRIALHGSLRSLATSKTLMLETVDDALWVWLM